MNIGFDQPLWLVGLVFAALPLKIPLQTAIPYSSINLIPEDPISKAGDRLIRLIAVGVVLALLFGLSEPYQKEQQIKKIGTGAHIVLLLDRSASMNDNFSGRHMGGRSSETKGRYAQKILSDFVRRRNNDLFAMASFSTSPIYTLPLTQDRDAILSALDAASMKGRGVTNMAAGLSMALDFFTDQPMTGTRIILLVSDGATRIDPDTQHRLKQWFFEAKVALYWIYLKNPNSVDLNDRPANPNEKTTPEYFLHQYFQNMNIPYHAFEADNPQALKQAIQTIEQMENKPMVYLEKIARKYWSGYCFGTALFLLTLLLVSKWIEIKTPEQ